MTRTEIIEKAKTIVEGHRDADGVEDSFCMIAKLWSDYLELELPLAPVDVCMMMVLLKVARVKLAHNVDDSLVDIAGYAACAGEGDD